MGIWVVVIVVGFLAGSFFGLKPRRQDVLVDEFRLVVRKLGFVPKLVATPKWIEQAGSDARHSGKLISMYTLLDDTMQLPKEVYQPLIYSSFKHSSDQQVVTGFGADNDTAVTDLVLQAQSQAVRVYLSCPTRLAPCIKAISTQANSVSVYIDDVAYAHALMQGDRLGEAVYYEQVRSDFGQLIATLKGCFARQ